MSLEVEASSDEQCPLEGCSEATPNDDIPAEWICRMWGYNSVPEREWQEGGYNSGPERE